jgi:hypothetical protein
MASCKSRVAPNGQYGSVAEDEGGGEGEYREEGWYTHLDDGIDADGVIDVDDA